MSDHLWHGNNHIPINGSVIEYIMVNGERHTGRVRYKHKTTTINDEPYLEVWLSINDNLSCNFNNVSKWRLAHE